MKFSIIIPVYNKQNSIRRTVLSALDQENISSLDISVILVDDGSTDDSVQVIKELQSELPNFSITLIEQENGGVSAARNKGVAEAKDDYVCFLDSDDTYRPNFLSEINSLIEKFPDAQLFGTSYSFVCSSAGSCNPARPYSSNFAKHRLIDNFFLEAAMSDLPFCASSFCISRKFFIELGQFPVGENMGEDQDLYIRAALNGKVAYSSEVCANYYIDVGDSLMASVAPDGEMPYSKRLQEKLESNELDAETREGAQRLIAGHLLDLVRRNIVTGDLATAKRLISDRRARKRPIKWTYWLFKYKIAQLRRST